MPIGRSTPRTHRPWRGVIAFLVAQLVLLVVFAVLRVSSTVVLLVFGLTSAAALAFVTAIGAPFVKRQLTAVEERNADLQEQRDLLARIMETSPTGIVGISQNGNIWLANAMAEQILGLSRDELSTRSYNDPAWQQVDRDGNPLPLEDMPVARVLATGRPVFDDIVGLRVPEGGIRFLSINAMPLIDDGEVTGAVASFLDITGPLNVERMLNVSEHLLHSSMDNMLEGCQILDHDLVYRYLNPTAEMHARRHAGELLGRSFTDAWPGVEDTELLRRMRRVLTDQVAEHLENEFTYPDSTIGWFELSIQPVPEGILILSSEITERKRAEGKVELYRENLEKLVEVRTAELQAANEELDTTNEQLMSVNQELDATNEELMSVNQELDASNEELREATAAKSQFLANMSHELRTPLNSIIGFSGILSQGLVGDLNEEQHRQVEMISRSGNRLLALINDVLDLSRIEARGVELRTSWFDAANVVKEVTDTLQPLALEKGLLLECEVPPEPVMLKSDEFKVRQIVLNLASNAVKFTNKGSVSVRLESAAGDTVKFTVSDTGIGIARQDQVHIFDAFLQVNDDDAGKPHGTGLGLTISREFAHLLGGHVEVESAVGEGSVFTLQLPTQAP